MRWMNLEINTAFSLNRHCHTHKICSFKSASVLKSFIRQFRIEGVRIQAPEGLVPRGQFAERQVLDGENSWKKSNQVLKIMRDNHQTKIKISKSDITWHPSYGIQIIKRKFLHQTSRLFSKEESNNNYQEQGWSILQVVYSRALNRIKSYPKKISDLKGKTSQLNFKGIEFPVKLRNTYRFEKWGYHGQCVWSWWYKSLSSHHQWEK